MSTPGTVGSLDELKESVGESIEEMRESVLEETDVKIEEALEGINDNIQEILGEELKEVEKKIIEQVRIQAAEDSIQAAEDVADSMDREAASKPGSSKIQKAGIWATFVWSKLLIPLINFLYTLFITLVLIVVYVVTGFFRGSLWLISLRWFLLLGIIGWFGTASFVANYDVVADVLRPIFQVLDDVGLRLIAPWINDALELGIEKGCNFYNFTVEFTWSIIRLFVEAIENIIVTQSNQDQQWLDDNIWGTAWADFYDGNKRMMGRMMPADPDKYLRTISLLYQRQLEYEDAIQENATFVRDSMHNSFDSLHRFGYTEEWSSIREEDMRAFDNNRGVATATKDGKTYRIPVPIIPRDFALYEIYDMQDKESLEKGEKHAYKQDIPRASEPKYEAQFLTESLLGFQFGWDPEGDFPRVNISETSITAVDGAVNFYVLVISTIDDVTDIIASSIEWFLTQIKQYTVQFALQFLLNLICGGDEDCELTKSVQRGEVHLRDELDDILDDIKNGDFSAFADLFEYLFEDDGPLAGWFQDAWEFLYTEVIRRVFQFLVNILFEIPCLNFDSVGCFFASLLDCILLIDLEVCLDCHDACDPGCADSETCPETCLPYASSCCPDDDEDVMICVEAQCRTDLDGLIAIFECFGRILLNVVGMLICPLMDVLVAFLDLVIGVFNTIRGIFESINDFIEDDLEGVFENLENFCDIIVRPRLCFEVGPYDPCFDFDFDVPNDDSENSICSVLDPNFDLNDLIIDPIEDVLEFLEDALEDFEGEVDDFCEEYGNLGEDICLSVGLPSSFCENLKEEPGGNHSVLQQVLRRRQLRREERHRGFSRANRVANSYDEIEWMAQYEGDNQEEDLGKERKEEDNFSADEDKEMWERRHREYIMSKEHPVARWYYRLTTENYRANRPTKQEFKDYILAQIRRDKIAHLMYVVQNPFSWYIGAATTASGSDENPIMDGHRRLARKLFDKTFVIDPNSHRESIGLRESKYKWDDTADYAEAVRHIQGNVSMLAMHALAVIGNVKWVHEEADFKYPERYEILGHLDRMNTKKHLSGILYSVNRYLQTYNDPNLIDLDRMVRIEAQRHTASAPRSFPKEGDESSFPFPGASPGPEKIPNPYAGAPSVRHRHLYATPKEKKAFRDLAKRYRWYRDTTSVHIGAHLKTMALVSVTSLMAPHMVDPVVNSLASRGPAFDAPLTKYLRHFGLTRHVHNITNELRQWRVRKLHQDELESGELETIVTMSHPKARSTQDIPYPYDRLYNAEDYRADYQQGKDFLAGKKVDLDRVVMSRNPDGTPKRIRSNALAREMSPSKIDEIHKIFPFSAELSHPKLMPMTRTEVLTRNVIIQERYGVMAPRAAVSVGTITTIAGGAKTFIWPIVKIILQNPQVALAVVYPAVISPLGQVSLGLWGRWGIRRFDEVFTDYLDFTPSGIEEVALDFAETLVYNLLYTFNFIMWIFMGVLLQVIFAINVFMITLGLFVFLMATCSLLWPIWVLLFSNLGAFIVIAQQLASGVISLIGFLPPLPSVDENGLPTQSPIIGYPYDLIFCNSSEGTCSSSLDCRGGTFCDCPEHKLVDYRNFLFTIGDTSPCEVPNSGTCLCWPQFKCDARLPINELAQIFTPDCDSKFGYNFREQVWFAPGDGTLDRIWTVVSASITNLWVQVRFLVRSFLVGWLGFVERAVGAFIGVAVSMLLLTIVKKPVWFFAWTIIAIWLWYFPSLPGDLYVDFVLPIFEDIADANITITTVGWIDGIINYFIDRLYIDTLFDMVIDYFRFPNFTTVNPLGTPDFGSGEVTCLVISSFSGFPGIIALLLAGVALLMTFATGLAWLLVGLVVQFFWLLAQWIWAFAWLIMEQLKKRGLFKNMKRYIIKKVSTPRMRRMAKRLKVRLEAAKEQLEYVKEQLEYAGSAEYMAATSRASMNYWMPLPTPSQSDIHKETVEMRREMNALKRQIRKLQERERMSSRSRMSAGQHFQEPDSFHAMEEGSSTDIPKVHTVVPLYPSTGLESRWEKTEVKTKVPEVSVRDVETGAGVGRFSASGLASTMTRGARGFQNLWQTIRPDADPAGKKFE